ncbi:hypothetical protein [Streptomyces sp. NPDC054794]
MRSRLGSGEVYRVRSPLGHEATLFSRYDDVRAVLQRFPGSRLADPAARAAFKHRALIYGLRSLPITW